MEEKNKHKHKTWHRVNSTWRQSRHSCVYFRRKKKNWSPPRRHLFKWSGLFTILLFLLFLWDSFTAMFAFWFTGCDFQLTYGPCFLRKKMLSHENRLARLERSQRAHFIVNAQQYWTLQSIALAYYLIIRPVHSFVFSFQLINCP